jgi:hypothetical protein
VEDEMPIHLLLGVLFRSWRNGGLLARAIIFVIAWAGLFELLLGAHPGAEDDPYSLTIRLGAAVCCVLAWIISGIPVYRRRRDARQASYVRFYSGFTGSDRPHDGDKNQEPNLPLDPIAVQAAEIMGVSERTVRDARDRPCGTPP